MQEENPNHPQKRTYETFIQSNEDNVDERQFKKKKPNNSVDYRDKTIEEIHDDLIKMKKAYGYKMPPAHIVKEKLGAEESTVARHLGKCGIIYDELKHETKQEAQQKYREYNNRIDRKRAHLNTTLPAIKEVIKKISKTRSGASTPLLFTAAAFGVSDKLFQKHLKEKHKTSFEALQNEIASVNTQDTSYTQQQSTPPSINNNHFQIFVTQTVNVNTQTSPESTASHAILNPIQISQMDQNINLQSNDLQKIQQPINLASTPFFHTNQPPLPSTYSLFYAKNPFSDENSHPNTFYQPRLTNHFNSASFKNNSNTFFSNELHIDNNLVGNILNGFYNSD